MVSSRFGMIQKNLFYREAMFICLLIWKAEKIFSEVNILIATISFIVNTVFKSRDRYLQNKSSHQYVWDGGKKYIHDENLVFTFTFFTTTIPVM